MTRLKHEGTINQRKDGKWQGQITINSKRYSVYGKTRPEAQEKLKELIKRHGEGLAVKPINYTVGDFSVVWLNTLKLKVRANSFDQQESLVRKHIIPELGSILLQKLTVIHIQELVNKKSESGLSSSTVSKIRNTLCAIIQYAVDIDLLLKNIVKLVKVKVSKIKEVQVLTSSQVRTLLTACRDHYLYPAILLLLTTGIRRSELCGIKWTDINWNKNTVQIVRSVVKYKGYEVLIHATKTTSSNRLLPLPSIMITTLRQHQAATNDFTGFIFARPDGQPMYPEVVYDYIKGVGKNVGLPFVTIRMLRHTVASLLLEKGENLKVIQELLGHSSITVTMDIYAHVSTGMKEQAVSKLTSLIDESAVQSAV